MVAPDLTFASALGIQRRRLTLQDPLEPVTKVSLRVAQFIGCHKPFVVDFKVSEADVASIEIAVARLPLNLMLTSQAGIVNGLGLKSDLQGLKLIHGHIAL